MTLTRRLAQAQCAVTPPCPDCQVKAQATITHLFDDSLIDAVTEEVGQALYLEDYGVLGNDPSVSWDNLDAITRQGYRRLARTALKTAIEAWRKP